MHTLDELVSGDEQEKMIRRSLHVSSDFYSMGHLLLYLLYSGYAEAARARRQSPTDSGSDGTSAIAYTSWESELALHPDTCQLLRRLLQVDQPYTDVIEVRRALEHVVGAMRGKPISDKQTSIHNRFKQGIHAIITK